MNDLYSRFDKILYVEALFATGLSLQNRVICTLIEVPILQANTTAFTHFVNLESGLGLTPSACTLECDTSSQRRLGILSSSFRHVNLCMVYYLIPVTMLLGAPSISESARG